MSHNRIAFVVIALLLTVSAIVLVLTGGTAAMGVCIYVVVAIAALAFSRARPDVWPGRLFEASRIKRASLTQRLLTQLAALVFLLAAHAMSGNISATLSVTGILLFIHSLVLARLPHRPWPHRMH
ncbi:hypothetical protein [Pseudomonas sp. fls2-241-R2A-110]|jgi:hypothetical protein|uniref:hypothetical protein n=1 Tax=Pseudomonas sp. fls2-241-R2A-110 TaxID=3040311 RepID=UPI002556B6B3|nr:hypothetical protein [Pseudomonas sp. fls2-241-R2A-110]